ncbi:hypothetical protein DACRYDRAFT_113520 [Dacryopinax primogenitus]|uniref:Uncharacterized protein n=1 Tax=Dacryopinax primogenitus (strain DJM 731) TaxID=1858805 RepID=M5GGF2_DACPD|nr:uncharacterized protein DACRYDRAFT_113520 [Dacryopinax primogenitus]EJU05383.1 hypothetical protein DACRYDRAFT_113520 [Dacryopinax primogenitus]
MTARQVLPQASHRPSAALLSTPVLVPTLPASERALLGYSSIVHRHGLLRMALGTPQIVVLAVGIPILVMVITWVLYLLRRHSAGVSVSIFAERRALKKIGINQSKGPFGECRTPRPPTPLPDLSTFEHVSPVKEPTPMHPAPGGRLINGRQASPPPDREIALSRYHSHTLHLLAVMGRREDDPMHAPAFSHNGGLESEAERGRSHWSGYSEREEVSPERIERESTIEDDRDLPRPPRAFGDTSMQSLGRPSTTGATRRSHDIE